MSLRESEVNHITACIRKWLDIRALYGKPTSSEVEELLADLEHSALLRRLLEGKNPLEFPPPLSFSRPWYSLLEEDKAETDYVYRMADAPELLNINQSTWLIQKEISHSEFICRYYYLDKGRLNWTTSLWRIKIVAGDLDSKNAKATITREPENLTEASPSQKLNI